MSKIHHLSRLCALFLFFGIATAQAQPIQSENTALIQPPYLKAGDTVAIVAPSGILQNRSDEVAHAVKLLESWGLHAVIGEHVFSQANHFAGSDAERCEDFQQALDDPKIAAIWCARGGYGTVRILDKLDYTKFKKHPKWLIGYSDITALHNQFHNEGYQTLHALMCTSLPRDISEIEQTVGTFKSALFGMPENYTLKGSADNRIGKATGELVGGNLTILHTMLGSETSIDTSGKILFIEEIGEYKYHIDRMLQSLKRAGYFDDCAGVLVGDMTRLRTNTTLWGSSVEQLILDALAEYDFPIAFNMPAGHEDDNRAMIFGRVVELNVNKEKSSIRYAE
ncbi:LD-carboxypeptidase [Subsaximicrobium wynnwilliamsii]|uniref:LD-carboxypeptidase n=1 Tax=Subsaximicrobium wynnwilliamsii TaxID=291179 RepID=A0A5C6ZE12_9FLAO|nr:LD-carboxypeptidase [Subsaximicrobium wynnwilliamsii]TXD82200.1 LD-carboxypeptidase [Subsaximicrobium wynnwilliamsii]TXD87840.1 LD-carboxypeptidase [Subsaximicrobium wynnwilliamsii]TXE01790.1 LD-carboxypeptidase [Subsaximicrobium wynnwilliamsii]